MYSLNKSAQLEKGAMYCACDSRIYNRKMGTFTNSWYALFREYRLA